LNKPDLLCCALSSSKFLWRCHDAMDIGVVVDGGRWTVDVDGGGMAYLTTYDLDGRMVVSP